MNKLTVAKKNKLQKLRFDGAKLHQRAAKAIGKVVGLEDGMAGALGFLGLQPYVMGIVVNMHWVLLESGSPWPVFKVLLRKPSHHRLVLTLSLKDQAMLKDVFDGDRLHRRAAKAIGKVVRLDDGMEVALNLPLQRRAVGMVVGLRWNVERSGPWPIFTVAFESIDVELNEFEIEWGE